VSSLPYRTSQMNAPCPVVVADTCAYFTALSPTSNTGIATGAVTAAGSGSPFIQINCPAEATTNGSPSGGKGCYFDYLKLTCTVAGASEASMHWDFWTDTLRVAPTLGSSGVQLTPNCTKRTTNGPSATTAVYAGSLTSTAASPQRISGGLVRPVIPVVGDTYIWKFGGDDFGPAGSLVPSGTAIADRYHASPPAIVDAGFTGLFALWFPSDVTPPAFEVELGFFEFY
jgi:hypothetical protein